MLIDTVHVTTEGLEAEYCEVLEYIPADKRLRFAPGSAGAKVWSDMPPSAPTRDRLPAMRYRLANR